MEHETDFEMGWEWIIDSDPGPSVRPFLGEEMLLMDPEKNEPHYFFEALFEAEMWVDTAHETNKYEKARSTQRCKLKTNIYCVIDYINKNIIIFISICVNFPDFWLKNSTKNK